MSTKTGWFDHGSNWEPDLLIDSRPLPQEPVEPEYKPHKPQRASVDHEWPIELGGEG